MDYTKLVNTMARPIDIIDKHGNILLSLPASDDPVKVKMGTRESRDTVNGDLRITDEVETIISYMPDPEPGTLYLVNRIVYDALTFSHGGPGRTDLVMPGRPLHSYGQLMGFIGITRVGEDNVICK